MKIALLGFDTEGRASYEYFKAQHAEITICDQNSSLSVPEDVNSQLGTDYLNNLEQFDLLVRTAGMPPHIILEANPNVADKITTLVNEFMRVCPTTHVIGVTGTKGKGTTSTLIAKMLEATGRQVYLGGNIGVPPLTFLEQLTVESWVVLELSSFQLMDLTHSPHIGVCLMVVPEHLNWHKDMAEYINAKSQLFAHQTSEDKAMYYAENDVSKEIASAGAGQKLPFYHSPGAFINGNMVTIDGAEICTTDDLKLLGAHNWQNICAALSAYWQVDQNIDAARSVLTTFSGLDHRLEFVRELDGVKYYDDSFGTTPETAIVAMQAFAQPKVVILGGSDKGASYDELARTVVNANVRKVLLIGDQADRIQYALEQAGFTDFIPGGIDMHTIVHTLQTCAKSGDIALLSPGCASFGMFKDYKDRGAQFKQQVQALVAPDE